MRPYYTPLGYAATSNLSRAGSPDRSWTLDDVHFGRYNRTDVRFPAWRTRAAGYATGAAPASAHSCVGGRDTADRGRADRADPVVGGAEGGRGSRAGAADRRAVRRPLTSG